MGSPKLVLLISAMMALTGCTDTKEPGAGKYTGPINDCESDGDCYPHRCHPTLKICAVATSTAASFIAQIVPGVQSRISPQVFHIQPSPDESLRLQLQSPVEVFDIGGSFNGIIVFENMASAMDGLPSAISVYHSLIGAPSPFFLLPGSYRVSLLPDEEERQAPPYYFSEIIVTDNGEFLDILGEPVIIDLPDTPDGYPSFKGRLKFQVSPEQLFPADGLQVVALEALTGQVLSTHSVSSCTTPASCGEFSLSLPETVESFILEVSKPEEPFHPFFHFTINNVSAENDAVFFLPFPATPILFNGRVTTPSDPDSIAPPTPACEVIFELISEDGSQSLEYRALTSDNGDIETFEGFSGVHLYPGDYRIHVFPSQSDQSRQNQYSVFETQIPVTINDDTTTDAPTWIGTLVSRETASGQVHYNDEPVPGASISATPLDNEASSVRLSAGESDNSGSFKMPMDEGQYFIVAEAPAQSLFAPGVILLDTSSGVQGTDMSIALAVPVVAEGALLPPEDDDPGMTFQGFTIEWYRQYNGKAFLVGRTAVSVDGAFTALLPP